MQTIATSNVEVKAARHRSGESLLFASIDAYREGGLIGLAEFRIGFSQAEWRSVGRRLVAYGCPSLGKGIDAMSRLSGFARNAVLGTPVTFPETTPAPACTRCGDEASMVVVTRHFGPERMCGPCGEVVSADVQCVTPAPVSETKIETPTFDVDSFLHDAIEAIRCGQPCVTSDIIDGPHAAEVKARLDALAVAPSPHGPGEFARLNRFLCDCVWGCDLPRLTALIWSPAPAESTATPSPLEVPDADPARRLDRRLARLVAVRPDPRVSPGGEDDGAVGLPVSLNAAPGLTTTPDPEIAPCCPCSPSSCSSPSPATSPSLRASWTRGSTRTDAPEAAPCRSSSTRRYGYSSATRAASSPAGTPASSSHAMLADAALASLLNRPWTTPEATEMTDGRADQDARREPEGCAGPRHRGEDAHGCRPAPRKQELPIGGLDASPGGTGEGRAREAVRGGRDARIVHPDFHLPSPWVTLAACPLGPDDLKALADAAIARDRRTGTEADRCPC